MAKAREFQKNIYVCFIDSAKAFDCVEHNKLWEILKEIQSLGLQGNWGVLGAGGEGDERG